MSDREAIRAAFGTRFGRVAVFEDTVGAGTVIDDRGDIWWFHCTAVSDGSRHVEADAPVAIDIGPGPNGLEAVRVEPLSTGGRS